MAKKISAILICFLMLFSLFPSASYAAGGSLSGPSTLRAGNTITVSFSISGYSKVYGVEGTIKYDKSLLTFKSASTGLSSPWNMEYNNKGDGTIKIIAYDNNHTSPISSGTIVKLKFVVSSSVSAGAKISVSTNGFMLSAGSATSPSTINVGNVSYSKSVSAPLSTNNYLSSLSVSGYTLSPSFSKTTQSYKLSVPYTVKSLNISAKAADAGAKVAISNNSLTQGSTTTVYVKVTSASGAKRTYSISTTVAKDPNASGSKTQSATSADLASLGVSNGILSPAFNSEVTSYVVYVPYEIENVKVSAKAKVSSSSVNVNNVDKLVAGEDNVISVSVKSSSSSEKIYTVTVKRAFAWGSSSEMVNPDEIIQSITAATDKQIPVLWDLASYSSTTIDKSVLEALRNNVNATLLVNFGPFKVEMATSNDIQILEDSYTYALYNDEGLSEAISQYLKDAKYENMLFANSMKLPNFQKIYYTTSFAQAQTLNIYRYNELEDKFYLIAKNIQVAQGGMISYFTNELGAFVFTPSEISGAVNSDASIDKNTEKRDPLTLDSIFKIFNTMNENTIIVVSSCALVTLLFGLLMGYLAFGLGKKRLRKKIRNLEKSQTEALAPIDDFESEEEINEAQDEITSQEAISEIDPSMDGNLEEKKQKKEKKKFKLFGKKKKDIEETEEYDEGLDENTDPEYLK